MEPQTTSDPEPPAEPAAPGTVVEAPVQPAPTVPQDVTPLNPQPPSQVTPLSPQLQPEKDSSKAVFAVVIVTVVIVLGLGLIAAYAFLKSSK